MSNTETLFWMLLILGGISTAGVVLALCELIAALLIGAWEDWCAWRQRRRQRPAALRRVYWPAAWWRT